jgi:hypothetical protein
VLHMRQEDLTDEFPEFSENERRNLIRFFHTPAYLPSKAWSTFQCSSWCAALVL